ncbi:MAG: AMP-binding protein [Deltaproteobacteria bacterium]|nr:AMP-binding protein [Deltaproteobacteria bacterium]
MHSQTSNPDSDLSEGFFPDGICIHQHFEYQARKHPEGVAVRFEGERLTYGELNQKANQSAHYLRNMGVKPGTLVGLFVQKSLEAAIGILGILKNSCAYVPLYPSYPKERLRQMVEDTESPVILTHSNLKDMLPDTGVKVICLDSDWKRISKEERDDPKSHITPDSLAYVIFTSGSTGRPKGVCCRHGGVTNLLTDFRNRRPLGPGDICSWWTSLSFDVSVYEIFSPLVEGATLIIVPESIRPDAPTFWVAGVTVESFPWKWPNNWLLKAMKSTCCS